MESALRCLASLSALQEVFSVLVQSPEGRLLVNQGDETADDQKQNYKRKLTEHLNFYFMILATINLNICKQFIV